MFTFLERDKDAAKTVKSLMSDFRASWILSNQMHAFDVEHLPILFFLINNNDKTQIFIILVFIIKVVAGKSRDQFHLVGP